MKKVLFSLVMLLSIAYNVQAAAVTHDVEGTVLMAAQYDDDDEAWFIRFKDADYKIALEVKAPNGQFDGTYTEADILYDESCFVTDLNEDDDYPFLTMTVTMKLAEGVTNPMKGCEITGTGVVRTGDTFNFHMLVYPPIKPKKIIDLAVDVNTAEWPSERLSGEGAYYELTESDNPTYRWTLAPYSLTGKANEDYFSPKLTYRENTVSGEKATLDHGNVIQSFDKEAKKVTSRFELVMSDSIQYNFQFDTPIITGEELSFSFTDLWLDSSLKDNGYQAFNATSDRCEMSMNLYNAEVPDTYSDEEVSFYLIVKGADGADSYINSLTTIYASSELAADGSPIVKAQFLGNDMNYYNIEASFVLPEIADTLHLDLTDAMFDDLREYNEGFYFYYSNEETGTSVYTAVKTDDSILGHYTVEDLSASSYIAFTDEMGSVQSSRFYAGDFDVNYHDNRVVLSGEFQVGSHHVILQLSSTEVVLDGIADIESKEHANTPDRWFNIAGQRVNSHAKGLVIKNGRKYFVK